MGDLSGFFARARPLESAVFAALIEQAEAPFIMDCLDPVRPFPAEKEQGILLYPDLEFWERTLKTLTPNLQENANHFITRSYLTLTE